MSPQHWLLCFCKNKRIYYSEAIYPEALKHNAYVKFIITERNISKAEFIIKYFLGINKIHALVISRLSSEFETFLNSIYRFLKSILKTSAEK